MKNLIRWFWIASISALFSFWLTELILLGFKADNWGAALFYGFFFIIIFQFIFAIFLVIFSRILRKISDNIMAILGLPSLVLASVSVASLSDSSSTVGFTFFYSLLLGVSLYFLALIDKHK